MPEVLRQTVQDNGVAAFRKHFPIVLVGVMASLGLGACSEGSGPRVDAGNKPDKVQIAAEGPFTGNQASKAAGALQAIKLALDEFNKSGGIRGTHVQLVIWDDHHDAQTATMLQAQGVSDPTILGLVGPMNASVAEASEAGLQGAHPPLPFITESVSSLELTDSGFSVAHRINVRDDKQAALDARFMIDQGARKIEILDSGTEYSRPMADAVQSYLRSNAPSILSERNIAKRGDKDFSLVVAKMKAFNADWVFFADEGPETALLVQQMTQAHLKIGQNIQFLGTDQTNDPEIITASQGAYQGAYASQITADPQALPSAASFVAAFKTEYGSDSFAIAGPFYGSAYAATQVLLQAINKSPVKDGRISRNDVLSHLASDTFATILGPIKYDSKGDVERASINIFQAQGTKMVAINTVRG